MSGIHSETVRHVLYQDHAYRFLRKRHTAHANDADTVPPMAAAQVELELLKAMRAGVKDGACVA
jgi:hypothetical protein